MENKSQRSLIQISIQIFITRFQPLAGNTVFCITNPQWAGSPRSEVGWGVREIRCDMSSAAPLLPSCRTVEGRNVWWPPLAKGAPHLTKSLGQCCYTGLLSRIQMGCCKHLKHFRKGERMISTEMAGPMITDELTWKRLDSFIWKYQRNYSRVLLKVGLLELLQPNAISSFLS